MVPVRYTISPACSCAVFSFVSGVSRYLSKVFSDHIVRTAWRLTWQQILIPTGSPAICVGQVRIRTERAVVLPPRPAGPIPDALIRRSASSSMRGLMLDESRHFFGKEQVLKFLDLMGRYKLNRFHWHLAPGQGDDVVALRAAPALARWSR